MNHYDLTPNAAERYFNGSIFGQLYTLMVGALGHRPPRARPAGTRPRAGTAAPTARAAPGLLDRLDRWFWQQEQNARDDYLATSADVFELERRIEALDRGVITRYY